MEQEEDRFDKYVKKYSDQEESDLPKRKRLIIGGIAATILLILAVIIIFVLVNGNDDPGGENTPESTSAAALTQTAEVIPTVPVTPSPTPTPSPTDTTTPTLTPTTTPTVAPTATETPSTTPTLTSTPDTTPTPSPTEAITATCICDAGNAALFTKPDSSSTQVGVYVEPDQEVIVLGRAPQGSWIFVEFENEQGWVDANRFELEPGVEFDDLPLAETPHPTWTPTGVPPGSVTPPPPPNLVAYWNVGSTAPTNNGMWQAILSVRVPQGGNYTFSIGDYSVTHEFVRNVENGFALYDVTISGMSCDGPLANDLIVRRNGQQLMVRNEFTNGLEPVFVSEPDC